MANGRKQTNPDLVVDDGDCFDTRTKSLQTRREEKRQKQKNENMKTIENIDEYFCLP